MNKAMIRSAPWYLTALLLIVVAGFWKSYFAIPPEDTLATLHAHAIPLLLWLGMLIVQPWLIHSGNRKWHRVIGKASFALFPIVAVTTTYIVFQDLGRNYDDPLGEIALGNFFSGFVHVAILVAFYAMAIYHRRNLNLHARYMLSTALPLVTPGIFRVIIFWLADFGFPVPSAFTMMTIVGIIPLALVAIDKLNGRIFPPFVYLTVAWSINLAGYKIVPFIDWWQDFASWSLRLIT